MKTQVLAAAIALFAGVALAQAPAEKAPATPGSTTAATGSTSETKAAKKAGKKKTSAKKKSTQSMGAGPAAPETDLSASARQSRIEAAYANWQSKR